MKDTGRVNIALLPEAAFDLSSCCVTPSIWLAGMNNSISKLNIFIEVWGEVL
jgi:hypothetical protein